MKNLNQKFILAVRNILPNEKMESYLNDKYFIRAFLVLKEYENDLLVVPLRPFKSSDPLKLILRPSDYPILSIDCISVNVVEILNKNQIYKISEYKINKPDYNHILTRLSYSAFSKLSNNEKIKAYEFVKEIALKKIRVGSVVIVKSEESFKTYYITKILEHDFEGIELKYSLNSGINVISDTIYRIPLDSLIENSVYSLDYSNYISDKIENYKLTLHNISKK